MISVVLVDDQALVRTGLRLVLEAEPDIQVVGEAADGRPTGGRRRGCGRTCS
jgi:DNA-binding NarL/FixJ family response regulator